MFFVIVQDKAPFINECFLQLFLIDFGIERVLQRKWFCLKKVDLAES